MEAIFEPSHLHLGILREKFGLASNDLLRVLVWCPHGGKPTHYANDDSALVYFQCSEDEKVQMEISRWANAFKRVLTSSSEDRLLQSLSPALYSVFTTHHAKDARRLIARTLRMLRFLESVLLFDRCSRANPYFGSMVSEKFPALDRGLRSLVGQLKTIDVQRDSAFQTADGTWAVSLPLLLIVAVAECHCEYLQPFAWEAYSAGRARDELRRRWKGLHEKFLNTVGLFIRCQSAVGQYVRGTGNLNFLNLVDEGLPQLAFDRNQLCAALKLLAVIEEARNRATPGQASASIEFEVNTGHQQEWGDENQLRHIVEYIAFDPDIILAPLVEDDLRNHTWSYFSLRFLAVSEIHSCTKADIDAFKKTLLREKPCLVQGHHEVISIGRTQTQAPLQALLNAIICGWHLLSAGDAGLRFKKLFQLQTLAVPHPFSGVSREYILQVLLRDDLAAERLLFPSDDRIGKLLSAAETRADGTRSPGDLFEYLVNVAKKELDLELDAVWEEKNSTSHSAGTAPIYVPFPLVRRITDVIYRLQPSLCLNIPINIDRYTTEWVHLPHGIKKKNYLHKRILGNFLLATVLNRAMAAGLHSADVDLENLAIPGSLLPSIQSSQDSDEEVMRPQDWRQTLQELYEDGGYNVLLDRYLRDYNSQRNNVHFEASLLPVEQFGSGLGSLAVGEVANDLGQYLSPTSESTQEGSEPDFWLLGVDIGGTLTKCQVFGFWGSSNMFRPIGNVFRMSTPPLVPPTAPAALPPRDSVRQATDEYATRLINLIKQRAGDQLKRLKGPNDSKLVVGLSWPGPVRENRPHGTSGILKVFGLSNAVQDNKIDDIWEVDVVGAVARAWEKEFNRARPFIALLNDGDADAVGAIIIGKNHSSDTFAARPPGLVLSVVKLGTGLAGALLRVSSAGLSLVPGLYEWGKIVLDLGAPLRKSFPQGAAREYLSKDALPRLAKRRGETGGFFQQDGPESAEIGLLLETLRGNCVKPYQALRAECGSIQGWRRPMYGIPLSAEVLRVVYKNPDADPELLFEVRLALHEFKNVEDRLREHLDEYGRTRLDRLIGYAPSRPDPPNDEAEAAELRSHPNFQVASEIAASCAETLGHYLGDFCVLLHDDLGVNEVILTGGVLSGETGNVAISAARKRVSAYGLSMWATSARGSFGIGSVPDQVASELTRTAAPGSHVEYDELPLERGALGAASFAAASFVRDKKQKGLQRLRSLLLELGPSERIEVSGTRVLVSGFDSGIDFREHALSEHDLLKFLEARGADWGFFQTDGPAVFVRWK